MRCNAASFLRLPGLLLAVLALVGQLAVGSLAPVDAAADRQLSELAAATSQCRTPPPGDPGHGTRHRRPPDCAPAAASFELALPGFVAAPSPVLPVPAASVAMRPASLLSARAPPSHRSHVGYPRGPPVLA